MVRAFHADSLGRFLVVNWDGDYQKGNLSFSSLHLEKKLPQPNKQTRQSYKASTHACTLGLKVPDYPQSCLVTNRG